MTEDNKINIVNEEINKINNEVRLKKISKYEGEKIIQNIIKESNIDPTIIQNFNKRKDYRSNVKFSQDMDKYTILEIEAIKFFSEYYKKKYSTNVEYKWCGNNGDTNVFVNHPDNRPDFQISINNRPFFKAEIKTFERKYGHKDINTFKKNNFYKYIEHRSYILAFMYDIENNKNIFKKCYIYYPKAVIKLNSYPPKTYGTYLGGKLAIRICYKEDLEKRNGHVSFEELIKENSIIIFNMEQ